MSESFLEVNVIDDVLPSRSVLLAWVIEQAKEIAQIPDGTEESVARVRLDGLNFLAGIAMSLK